MEKPSEKNLNMDKKRSRGALPSWLIFMAMGFLSFFGIGKKRRMLHLAQNTRAWENLVGRGKKAPDDSSEITKNDGQRNNVSGVTENESEIRDIGSSTTDQESGIESEKKIWIDDQNKLSEFIYGRESRFLGKRLLGGRSLCGIENTCEVIAVYNALLALGRKEADFPQLLERFERRGISLGGYFGTSFGSLIRFCKSFGLNMTVLKGAQLTPAALSGIASPYVKACIMMTENVAGDIRQMIHTVCITREDGHLSEDNPVSKNVDNWMTGNETVDGDRILNMKKPAAESNEQNAGFVYRIHNDYEGCRSYPSLTDAVFGYHKGKGRPLGVILLR